MVEDLAQKKCIPCQGGMPAMSADEAHKYLSQVLGWELVEDKKIKKEFKFNDFKDSLAFLNQVGAVAEQERHHPAMAITYNSLRVTLYTHAIGGLSQNDFIMAAKINKLGRQGQKDERSADGDN